VRVGITLTLALAAATLIPANASPDPGPRLSPILGGHGATAVESDATPGARPIALTIRLHTELQCGRFTPTSITVSLPPSMRVPASVSKDTVKVARKTAASVRTSGTRVLIHIAPPKTSLICDAIGPGVVAIKFTRLAGLGNPPHAGFYAFSVATAPHGSSWHGTLSVR
jgi:hypothetical protein